MRPGVDLRLPALDPQDLRHHVAGAERTAVPFQDLLLPVERGQFSHLIRGPRVDAVEDRFAKRAAMFVHRNAICAERADPDGLDVLRVHAALAQQFPTDRTEITPPVALGVMLVVTGLGIFHAVLRAVQGENLALLVDESALAGIGAGIDADKISFSHRAALTAFHGSDKPLP